MNMTTHDDDDMKDVTEMHVSDVGDAVAARRALDANGYLVVASAFTQSDVMCIRTALRRDVRPMTQNVDVLGATDVTAGSRVRLFGAAVQVGVANVYHTRTQYALRQNRGVMRMFEAVTATRARWMLTESLYVRVEDALSDGYQRSGTLTQVPLTSFCGTAPGVAGAPYEAPYRAYLFLTDHVSSRAEQDGMLEVVPRGHQHPFVARRAAGTAGVNDRTHWTVPSMDWVRQRAQHVVQVPVTAGSIVFMCADTLHSLCQGAWAPPAPCGYAKVVVPLTYLEETPANRRWVQQRQHPAYLKRASPLAPAATREYTYHAENAFTLPPPLSALGRRLIGLDPPLDAPGASVGGASSAVAMSE